MLASSARVWLRVGTVTLALLGALAVAKLVWLHWPRGGGRETTLFTGAYLTGGSPTAAGIDPAVEHVLGEDLAELVVATDRDARGSSQAAATRGALAARLRAAPAMQAYGPALAAAWQQLLAALDAWDRAQSRPHVAELRAAARELSEQLAAVGLGYQVIARADSDRVPTRVIVFAFRVVRVDHERAGDARTRVLTLARLDRIDVAQALLGMESSDGGDPVVLLDQIAETAMTKLAELDALSHGAVGRELARLAPPTLDPVTQGRRVIDALAASVRRHEARHAIDLAAGAPPALPAALARYLPAGDRGGDTVMAFRARAELAAYLAQIASDPDTPQIALWNLASLALNDQRDRSAEALVGAVVVESLARHLGVPIGAPAITAAGAVDHRRLLQLAAPLAALDDDALRSAARQAWLDLFHAPLEPVVDG